MLDVTDLVKSYGGGAVQAVRGVSFAVSEGSFFTLLGPSGCGKTTILRSLAGLERPDGGQIAIAGQTVFSAAAGIEVPAESRPIGMVFQSYAIWPHMTVFDNAAFPLRHGRRHLPAPEIRRRVLDMLGRVGLDGYASRWATQLSGGQQQRLALARALLREPQLLLLDEPLSNLDARLRAALRGELKSFQRLFGVTTVYVTHDQTEALSLSDQVLVLRDGTVQQSGSPRQVYAEPASAFVAGFIGNANLLPARVSPDGDGCRLACSFGEVRSARAWSGGSGEALLCVRPEDVEVVPGSAPSDTNVFTGRVTSLDFVGESVECVVALAGAEVRARLHPARSVAEGSEVLVHLSAERCTVVPADRSEAGEAPQAAGQVG